MLVLLAASPFTAPFSTCDLPTLFGYATAAHAITAAATALSVAVAPDNDDAYSISPVVLRADLRGQPAAYQILPIDLDQGGLRESPRSSRALSRAPHDPPDRLTVLRL